MNNDNDNNTDKNNTNNNINKNNTHNLKEKILQGTLKSLETFSINKINDIIRKSEKEKREYGIMFCSDIDIPPFGNITHSDLCVGNECSVDINNCTGKKQIGTFHTHPHNKTGQYFGNLSGRDIYGTISHKQSFSCIGSIEENKPTIKCFAPSLDIDPTIILKSYMAQDDYAEKLSILSKATKNTTATRKNVDDLIDAYDKRMITDDELYKESEALAKRLLSKKADLIIRR